MKPEIKLYEVKRDVKCLKCGNHGAVRLYGHWHPNGLGEKTEGCASLQEYKDKEYMDLAVGFGGTIPYECLNCRNFGLIDIDGLETYKKAFVSI